MAKRPNRYAAAAASGATRTQTDRPTLPARPADPAEDLLALAEQLPKLDEVRAVDEADDSPLTLTEQAQRTATEQIIEQASRSANAALWIIAMGLERAAKGRWWRGEYATFDDYVRAKVDRSSSYVRRLRAAAPLALEAGRATGVMPNPGQARELHKTEQRYGRARAVKAYATTLTATAEAGVPLTAAHLAAVHRALPRTLAVADEDQAAVIIEQATRATVGVPIDTPDDAEIVDAEIVEDQVDDEHQAAALPLHDALAEDAFALYARLGSAELKAEAAADPGAAEEKRRRIVDALGRALHRARGTGEQDQAQA